MKWQESEILEFKESLNELSSEHGKSTDGVAAVVAFANRNGGVVYFGVKNDGTEILRQGASPHQNGAGWYFTCVVC